MKNIFYLCAFLLSTLSLAQEIEKPVYFPQEQLIHPNCKSEKNPNKCLGNLLADATKPVLEKEILTRTKLRDTLKVRLTFSVDPNGDVLEDLAWGSINDSIMRKTLKNRFKYSLISLPRFEVENLKPEAFKPRHNFYIHFTKKEGSNELQEIAVDSVLAYTGGDIFEAPLFKGCKRKSDTENRNCFQQKIQKHISANFQYPKEAQKKGIEGKVYIMFTIGKNGNIENIKTKGPDPILEQEAVRIIKLLPKPSPGLKNGEGVKVPFSLPITFRLQ